jgi:hypothetical protein
MGDVCEERRENMCVSNTFIASSSVKKKEVRWREKKRDGERRREKERDKERE